MIFLLRTEGRTGQPEVVQEVLADLKKLDGTISPESPSEVKVKSPGCGKLEVDDGEDGDHLFKIHFNRYHNTS